MKMAHVSPSSNVVAPVNGFVNGKNSFLSTCNVLRTSRKQVLLSHRCTLPMSTSVRLFPQFRIGCALQPRLRTHVVSVTNADVAVEEADAPVSEKDPSAISETPSSTAEASENPPPALDGASSSSVQSKRPRPARKSEMPPVKNEELIPGASFAGKVRSIQPFGAFVDFGAFTDGLVHVSRLSDGFVKDVGDVVSVGQEVTVKLVEANIETGRISLTMRDEDSSKNQKSRDGPSGTSRAPRKFNQKNSKFSKGQELEGTVKNVVRAGCFITLPEGEEGFLSSSEEAEDGSFVEGSSLQIGQEVKVRVLNISRGKVQLTMKKQDASAEVEVVQGVVHTATNPFVLAFQSNKDISTFLDEQVKLKEEKPTEESPAAETTDKNKDQESLVSEETTSAATDVVDDAVNVKDDVLAESSESVDSESKTVDEKATEQVQESLAAVDASANVVDDAETTENIEDQEIVTSDSAATKVVDDVLPIAEENSKEDAVLESSQSVDETPESLGEEPEASSEVLAEKVENSETAQLSQEEPVPAATEVEEPAEVLILETNGTTSSSVGEVGSDLTNSETTGELKEQSDASPEKETTRATISPALVKQLREETGAGMMDCKKALSESEGEMVKAQEYLRKKGLASADKKASRATAEGRIGSYIHDSRIGVLIEVNCETDFVSRGDIFKELVEDLAMQVAACPQVQYLTSDDVPKEIVEKEREIEMQKEDLASKPEQIRTKIVVGRIRKRLEDLALLDQPYIKNDKLVVKDFVKQTIATIGENIKVNRFVRYNLGEGLQKKSQDFAAEVAAQTSAKPATPKKEEPAVGEAVEPAVGEAVEPAVGEAVEPAVGEAVEPAVGEAVEPVEKPVKVAISAALVKQLREETGAGMMDCKKALSETDGDLEKAQEYLRKKGLSSADKKSSRLAAEGRIGSYIHDARIGVLIEVNCETDFVGRGENFKTLVEDLAMQVVACPQVQYVSIEDIPADIVSKEKALEMQREDLQSKPENIREKIVEGRISKRFSELALLEQPFIKDDSLLVKDLVKQTVAALGENIKVRRFTKFTLGEASKPELSGEEAVAKT